jgi:hypothetical protein
VCESINPHVTILPSQLIELAELPMPIEAISPFTISNEVFLIISIPLALAVTSFPIFSSKSDVLLMLEMVMLT